MGVLSLERVIVTGDWSPLRPDASRREIVDACGEPQDVGNPDVMPPGFDALKYGDVEMCLIDGVLQYVQIRCSDRSGGGVPCGASNLTVDPWICRPELSLAAFMAELKRRSTPYTTVQPSYDERQRIVVLRESPKVYAIFADWNDHPRTFASEQLMLDSIWLGGLGT